MSGLRYFQERDLRVSSQGSLHSSSEKDLGSKTSGGATTWGRGSEAATARDGVSTHEL
jgi:hypothetical protein